MVIPTEANPVDVTSSNLKRVGYIKDKKTLFVEFTDNSIYKYSGVPEAKYNAMLSAGSVGKFFTASIRSKYSYEKV